MTSFFAIFIFMGIFNAINSRTERINIFANIFKNITFIIIFGIIFIVQIIIIYYGGNLFRTYGLNIYELLYVLGISFSVIPINQLRKIINKKRLLDNY